MKNIDNKGFSLIEVIIAMAIFAIGAGGLYSMQFTSAAGNTKANQQTGAVAVATQVVEELMKTSYTASALARTMQPDGTIVGPPHDSGELLGLKFDHAPYINLDDITWNVMDLENSHPDNAGIKQIDLTVIYPDPDKYRHTKSKQVNISFVRIEMI